jgi:hypothetical protein
MQNGHARACEGSTRCLDSFGLGNYVTGVYNLCMCSEVVCLGHTAVTWLTVRVYGQKGVCSRRA